MDKSFSSFTDKKKLSEYYNRLKKATENHKIEEVGESSDGFPIYRITINEDSDRTVGFSSGIHGNEPAGPYGVLKFFEDNIYVPKTKRVVIIPLGNPDGFLNNTRVNSLKEDINRKFYDKPIANEAKIIWEALKDEPMELLATLHEDPELESFYLYYTHHKDLAEQLRDTAKKYFSICEQETIYKDKLFEGLIPLPHTKRGTLEDRVLDRNIPYITIETPGKVKLEKRILYNCKAIQEVINGI